MRVEGFELWGLGFRHLPTSGVGFRGGSQISFFVVRSSEFRVPGFRIWGPGSGFRISGLVIRVADDGFRISGFGFRVSGCEVTCGTRASPPPKMICLIPCMALSRVLWVQGAGVGVSDLGFGLEGFGVGVEGRGFRGWLLGLMGCFLGGLGLRGRALRFRI